MKRTKARIKGTVSFENGAKPKPHEIPTAMALADRLRRGHGIKRLIFVNRKREVVDINEIVR